MLTQQQIAAVIAGQRAKEAKLQAARETDPVAAAIDDLTADLDPVRRSGHAFDRSMDRLDELQQCGDIDPPAYRDGWEPQGDGTRLERHADA